MWSTYVRTLPAFRAKSGKKKNKGSVYSTSCCDKSGPLRFAAEFEVRKRYMMQCVVYYTFDFCFFHVLLFFLWDWTLIETCAAVFTAPDSLKQMAADTMDARVT